jgi:outer membrane protein assembly factor BamB
MLRYCWKLSLCAWFACLAATLETRGAEVGATSLQEEFQAARGLCVLIGIEDSVLEALQSSDGLLVHCLDASDDKVAKLTNRLDDFAKHRIVVEHWASKALPQASNLANLVVVSDSGLATVAEVERILCPGGVALTLHESGVTEYTKPTPASTDEWTHQWHATDGSLTTEDEAIGVPTGLQWLSGPLFAMAGRKSSTQTLVSAGGINFYVTQNVAENVGKPTEEMRQFLVAWDAYNGLIIWKKHWDGPFVSGDGETNPRMIASSELLWAVTGSDTVSIFDAKTGELLRSRAMGCAIDKILHYDSDLLVQSSTAIVGVDYRLRGEKWRYSGRQLSELTISDKRGYLLESGRSADGQFQHDLIGLDLHTGQQIFRTNTQPNVTAARVRVSFVKDGLVALQAHGSLHLFDDSGEHLWSKATEARPGKDYVDERYVGHFYRHGLVWMLLQNSPREPLGQNKWVGLNPHSGQIERELETQGVWPATATPAKMGCQVLLASDRYIMIPRQSTFIDFETGNKYSFKFTRGGCGLGFVPANGLMYSHPHACGCFSEAIRGFMGMHAESVSTLVAPDVRSERLTFRFRPELKKSDDATAWPIYRSSGQRGAFASAALSNYTSGVGLKSKWQAAVCADDGQLSRQAWALRTGNKVSACTVAEGTVFVSDVDAGRLSALDLSTGQLNWEFLAAGRIDSPPTIHGGLCVFGSHDGYVYCLNAQDGKLAWKYRVAPSDRRIVAFGGLESSWPVAGTVLIKGDRAYAAAGRAPDADGGLFVVALELQSGQTVWEQSIQGGDFRGLCDYLIDGGDSVFLSNWKFDASTGEIQDTSTDTQHLRGGKVGLLEPSWTKHDLALRKDIQTWTAGHTSGQLIAFGPRSKATFQAESHRIVIDAEDHFELELAPQEQVTCMALTPQHVVVAGGLDRSDTSRGGFLRIIDLSTGRVSQSLPLPAEAAFDSLAVAGNYVLVSTQSGLVCCFQLDSL